jgi:hypothetical protein
MDIPRSDTQLRVTPALRETPSGDGKVDQQATHVTESFASFCAEFNQTDQWPRSVTDNPSSNLQAAWRFRENVRAWNPALMTYHAEAKECLRR